MTALVLSLLAALVISVVGLQWQLARKAQRAVGQPLPVLPPDIDAALHRHGVAVLYCFSPTCGPCRAMTPRIDRLMTTHDHVFKLDIRSDPALARALGVQATPTTLRLTPGRIDAVYLGALPDGALARVLA